MHNLYAIFVKFLETAKQISSNLVNEKGNISRGDLVLLFRLIRNRFEFDSKFYGTRVIDLQEPTL